MQRYIIFTDLDGTLLDHHSYSFEPVRKLLDILSEMGVPVVANTSKTKAELLQIRATLGNTDPFVVENGSAVYIPKNSFSTCPEDAREEGIFWCKTFAQPREHWLSLLQSIPKNLRNHFVGFSQMSTRDIVDLTGLSHEQAQLAAQRQFGEPLHWKGSEADLHRLESYVEEEGGRVLRGGRFVHIGSGVSKADSLVWLTRQYASILPDGKITTIALGDSQNDVAMLEIADYAVIIASPAHAPPELTRSTQLVYSSGLGPVGWNEEIRRLLHLAE